MYLGNWWPMDLGVPASSGSGESLRYAYFPLKHRLVIEQSGAQTIYDTGEYQFRGAIQANFRDAKLSFWSQRSRIDLDKLSIAS